MPMLKIKGISKEEVKKESTKLVDSLVEIIECPRDYFTIEIIGNTFIMDGMEVKPSPMIDILWFDRGQDVQDKVAKVVTDCFKKDRDCLEVVFYKLDESRYYENGEHY
ncbi:DUF1904 domain-containing protein [Clostridium sardiniense]|uniref:DUF1904 domain-containing protein n=1 Tax=Clostridium sardiniense TaxID=29369 RepID=A0ABS7KUX1_CLOSR|nr:DUF1904 family protein [Clostridium sardiniense]MBY0754452.1 DUF1904 domain-containing protein [Clostridium sardiniense]MDQ0460099.1 phenylpyruvate tautomerase PptA (4-oxalocrotonate tautomerase family) [Clostridium sardiniense]